MGGYPKAKKGAKPAGALTPKVKGRQAPAELAPRARPPAQRQEDHPRFSWVWADTDYEGSWRWFTDAEAAEMLRFMIEMERLTWSQVHQMQAGDRRRLRRHHAQEIETLSREAQDRLVQLTHLEGIIGDELFRFRLQQTHRLWGVRVPDDDTFYVLWWDPDHNIYPT